MRALDWINDLLVWLSEWFPRIDLIQVNQAGVLHHRKGVKELTPGLYWYVPAIHNVESISTARQPLAFSQRLTTADGVPVQVAGVAVYRVTDALTALVLVDDLDATAEEAVLKGAVKPITSRTFDQILTDLSESNQLRNELASGVRSALRDLGITLDDAFFSDFTRTRVYSHDGSLVSVE